MIVSLPYKVVLEHNVKDKINEFLTDLNLGKKVGLVCNSRVMEIIGQDLKEEMEKVFDVRIVKPSSIEKSELEKLSETVKDRDFIIGLGGGRSIDVAKYLAYLTNRPWIAFPTILSHDGVVSSRASLSSNSVRISVKAKEPYAIISDIDVLKKAPYRWMASGAGDVLSNISAVEDWKIASRAGKEKYHTVIGELAMLPVRAISRHVDDIREMNEHGIEILFWSLVASGLAMNIYGSSRPCSGSEHNFSHALDYLHAGALHGEQCALGGIIILYLQNKKWEKYRSLLKRLGLPTTSSEIGIPEDILVKALVMARDIRDRYTILNEVEIDERRARRILNEVGII